MEEHPHEYEMALMEAQRRYFRLSAADTGKDVHIS